MSHLTKIALRVGAGVRSWTESCGSPRRGPFSSELREMMGNNFVPVRWGDRRYLIPEKERLLFCSAVNQGAVPRYMRRGPFSLRDADRRKAPEALPEVPPE